jgi:inosose dehydratase
MKVATAPVNWNSPHVPDYRPATPYPQLLEEMKAAGYTATEWSTDMPKDPVVLAADLQAHGLRLLGGYVELELRTAAKRDQEIQRGVEIGKFFRSLGGAFLIAADGGDQRRTQEAGHVNPEGGLTDAQWRSLCEGLNEVGATLRSAGIQVAFHNHVGTYVETEAETSRLLDGTDPSLVGWCLDCGHLAYGAATPFGCWKSMAAVSGTPISRTSTGKSCKPPMSKGGVSSRHSGALSLRPLARGWSISLPSFRR